MPRNPKCRRVCCEPENRRFTPEKLDSEFVILSIDELESIRLCDLEEISQDSAASRMGVPRGTFQRILYSARKSVADALCNGKGILIEGGNYELVEECCKCQTSCSRCRFAEKDEEND